VSRRIFEKKARVAEESSLSSKDSAPTFELAGVNMGDDGWAPLIDHEMRYGEVAATQKA
jgi:hypothetical protein